MEQFTLDFKEGARAFIARKSRKANPEIPESIAYKEWVGGWKLARNVSFILSEIDEFESNNMQEMESKINLEDIG